LSVNVTELFVILVVVTLQSSIVLAFVPLFPLAF
jgi:hypothetical protein